MTRDSRQVAEPKPQGDSAIVTWQIRLQHSYFTRPRKTIRYQCLFQTRCPFTCHLGPWFGIRFALLPIPWNGPRHEASLHLWLSS